MMEGRSYYAVENVYSFVYSLFDRSLGFVERSSKTRMTVSYMEMINKLPFDQDGAALTARAGRFAVRDFKG